MRILSKISLIPLLLFVGLALAPAAQADTWYGADGASWSQAFISESDGTTLHADVLRPAGLPAGAKTPVILSIGPYFNHSGQTGPAGPVQGTSYDPIGANGPQPSDRFRDFVDGTQLIKRGYSYVMVDLRGFGGSSGCLDWGGPGEQADVKNAVQWAASQPWSTGSVGMYGKSYDAVTGVIGEAQQPTGLKAVVGQEPVYDMYRYLYTNGVRYLNSLATPGLYDGIAATPGPITDSPQYQQDAINDTARPGCAAQNYSDQASNSDHSSAYWQARNLIAATRGHTIPFFLTQGFLENNTKPDGAWDFFNGLAGPKKAWFGMWDHIRGNDVTEGDNAAPHPWFDQVMRFYDHYVRGLSLADAPTDQDPAVSVETGAGGSWRAEQQWPPLDSTGYTTPLRSGTYTDSFNAGTTEEQGGQPSNDTVGAGLWTISPPLANDVHFAGVPTANLDVTASVPNATLSVDVYDIDAKNSALLLSRTAYLLAQGENRISPQMYGNDWTLPAGHRIGVLVTSANDGWWTPAPTQSTVTVNSGSITLPFLRYTRPDTIPGKRPTRLDDWLKNAPFTIDAATVSSSTSPGFVLPPALVAAPAGFNAGARGEGLGFITPGSAAALKASKKRASKAKHRIRLRLLWHGSRTLVAYGDAPAGWKLRITARLGKHTVRTRTVRATKFGRFRVSLRLTRGRRYIVRAVGQSGRLSASSSAAARSAPHGR